MKNIKLSKQILFYFFTCYLLAGCVFGERDHYVKREEGFVPDEITAIRIAQAVWFPIYGEEQILKERPFRATLEKGVWTVRGSLSLKNKYKGGPPPKGGTAVAEIAKKDGRIIRITHEK